MTAPERVPDWRSLTVEVQAADEDGGTLLYQLPDEWFAVVTLLRGSCQIEGRDADGRRCVALGPGDICRVAPNHLVRLSRTPPGHAPFEVACLRFPTDVLRHGMEVWPSTAVRDLSVLHTLRVFDPHIASMASALLRARDSGADDDYAASAAHYLAACLLRSHSDTLPRKGGLSPERLLAVTTYIHEHLAGSISLEDLARQAELSRFHFNRLFTASTGRTPHQFVTDLRMDRARWWLEHSDESVAAVGRRCGCPNAKHFATVFRREVGCSSSVYRQQPNASRRH